MTDGLNNTMQATTDGDHGADLTAAVGHPPVTGQAYWRSLDELADTPAFRQFVENEFPSYAPQMLLSGTRRHFLKIMGASVALAGLAGCRRWPQRKLAPHAERPEGHVPGVPEHYATAMELDGVAQPLVATAFDGRPIKLEGNVMHPASGGAATLHAQAAILDLYDPHRAQSSMQKQGEDWVTRNWADARVVIDRLRAQARGNGKDLAIVCPHTHSPTIARMRREIARQMPGVSWVGYRPLSAGS